MHINEPGVFVTGRCGLIFAIMLAQLLFGHAQARIVNLNCLARDLLHSVTQALIHPLEALEVMCDGGVRLGNAA